MSVSNSYVDTFTRMVASPLWSFVRNYVHEGPDDLIKGAAAVGIIPKPVTRVRSVRAKAQHLATSLGLDTKVAETFIKEWESRLKTRRVSRKSRGYMLEQAIRVAVESDSKV